MREIRISNLPVVTGFCDPNKSQAWHHRSNKLYFYKKEYNLEILSYLKDISKAVVQSAFKMDPVTGLFLDMFLSFLFLNLRMLVVLNTCSCKVLPRHKFSFLIIVVCQGTYRHWWVKGTVYPDGHRAIGLDLQ